MGKGKRRALEDEDRLALLIGRDHGLAEAREVVAEFLRLVDAQIGDCRGRVKLELVDAVVGFECGKASTEQPHQRCAIAARHRFLHRGDGGDDGAHRGGAARFLAEPRLQRIIMAAQFALVGAIDDAGDDPHRPQQHEHRRAGRGEGKGRGDPRPQAQMEALGERVSGAGHSVEIPERY